MSLAARVGDKRFEIGDAAFLKAWFSTIVNRLESEDWGNFYPVIMRDLYSGSLSHSRAADALKELAAIRAHFAQLPPDRVVWDFENPDARPTALTEQVDEDRPRGRTELAPRQVV